ncbi:putative transcription factor MADS-type1 family [Arabidopsis thaliana]|uniref:AGAMOUS-like 99 n=4 Tax=Arabidopsis TaxID=3701 RepID=Q9LZ61_ARATH|nr:AGAMOUS-like 99 [Arabidopsis thaliana]KAG7601174.1 Transcription factor MADS-box [Arabidopsis thaliana x Arabidopsis arenosa]KAG7608115.1 Transcription factor MADS-box [Arabidopsis suecica]AAY78815.1 MADS-box family protein [Arabidopsis thaliana]AED90768.1 AGAMOUS-like 99 [Arabidopsis thaliana]OAO94712.1 AGL99 [Arabidopsis thaliana]|eukprot:NP_196084.1 AGAMOUS-like 99 [Arabidopsis thaliana]
MGGVKRKISIELIEKKDSRAVAFSKRSRGLYSKASDLCLLSDAQIAIIATPVSSKSNVSFYTFGHSSVDNVVAAFLTNQRPREGLGLDYWWEDERLSKSEDLEELRDAMDSMSKMLKDLKDLQNQRDCEEDVKKKGVLHGTHQKQTFNPESCSVNFDGFNKNTEEFDLDEIFDYVSTAEALSMNLDMDDVSVVTTNQNPVSASETVEDRELVVHKNMDEDNIHVSDMDDKDTMLMISDKNNVLPENLDEFDQELDLDQLLDFETNYESLLKSCEMEDYASMVTTKQNLCSNPEAVEDGGLMIQKDLPEDNLCFSDYFSDLHC